MGELGKTETNPLSVAAIESSSHFPLAPSALVLFESAVRLVLQTPPALVFAFVSDAFDLWHGGGRRGGIGRA